MPPGQPNQGQGYGLPPKSKLFSLAQYKGLNTKARRPGIDDEEFSWCENFFPIGTANLRTLYGPAAATYTASGTSILYVYMFNISTTNYAFLLLNNGQGVIVNAATGAPTVIGGYGTFGADIACAQWGNQYLQIITTTTGYFIWEPAGGLHSPGGAGPGGTGTMPTGIYGSYIENFQSRVWIVNGAVCTYSAPGNPIDFSPDDGAGSFTSTDSFLRTAFYAVKQAAGFLYLFGDSSMNVISNVQTTGTTPVTTFNNSNTDPQTGTSWPNTLQAFGRALVFANQSGVYALYGGSAEKVSDALDGVFANANAVAYQTTMVPSAAVVTLFGIKCYALALYTTDPSGINRPVIFLWDGKKWFSASQANNNLFMIATQQATSIQNMWATDGVTLFQCLNTPSSTLTKTYSGKLWQASNFIFTKQALRLGVFTESNTAGNYAFTASVDDENGSVVATLAGNSLFTWFNSFGTLFSWTNASSQPFEWFTIGYSFTASDVVQAGRFLGITLTTKAQDITIIGNSLEYQETTPW